MIQKELNKNEQLFRQLYEAIRGGFRLPSPHGRRHYKCRAHQAARRRENYDTGRL